jgi:PmbA protein
VLGYAVNGKDVYDKISYFADKLGEKVASEELNIYDWGNMSKGLCSKKIDDEGLSTRRTPLIEHGELVGFVYDCYYASKMDTESTGNGLRLGDLPGRCYAVEPSPYITNLFLESGSYEWEELIAETRKGLLLSRIWYTYPTNPQLGDFSTTSRCGFLIEEGKIVKPIKQVRIYENLPGMLKRVVGIGDDQKQIMPWGASASICTPSLKFAKVRIGC